jgi:hypothetical protein
MQSEIVCRCCGMVLALVPEGDASGFIVSSPGEIDHTVEIVPRARTVLRCTRCGTVRPWYPPSRKHTPLSNHSEGPSR